MRVRHREVRHKWVIISLPLVTDAPPRWLEVGFMVEIIRGLQKDAGSSSQMQRVVESSSPAEGHLVTCIALHSWQLVLSLDVHTFPVTLSKVLVVTSQFSGARHAHSSSTVRLLNFAIRDGFVKFKVSEPCYSRPFTFNYERLLWVCPGSRG